jgi:hypothetical protein
MENIVVLELDSANRVVVNLHGSVFQCLHIRLSGSLKKQQYIYRFSGATITNWESNNDAILFLR